MGGGPRGRGALLAAASTREGIAPQPCACQWPAMRGGGVLAAQHELPHAQRQRERRQGDAEEGLEGGGGHPCRGGSTVVGDDDHFVRATVRISATAARAIATATAPQAQRAP